jgi:hypothetical protein
MNSTAATTRVPGLLYLLMGLPAVFNLQYMPSAFIVPGDAAATARRITDGALVYRAGVLCGLVSNVGFLLLALSLYDLFRHVDRKQALLLVVLVAVSAAIGIVNEVPHLAPLAFLSGANFLSAFTRPQLEALSMAFLRLYGSGLALNATLWGLWLFPFGVLVIKSRTIPGLIGYCLIVGGFAYLATSVAGILWPAYRVAVANAMTPLYAIGEVPIFLWLLIRGARVPPVEARSPVLESIPG